MPKNFHVWTVAILFGWLLIINPGAIEGSIFPVVQNTRLVATEMEGLRDSVSVKGTAEKIRRCSGRNMEWFIGDREGENESVGNLWGPVIVRPVGDYKFESWIVRVFPPDVLIKNTFADALHQCYLVVPLSKLTGRANDDIRFPLPWWTRTRFWN